MTTRKKDDRGITPVPAAAVDAFPRGTGLTVSGELNYLMRRMMEHGADGVTSSTSEEWPVARLEGESVSAEVIFTPQAQSPHELLAEDQVDQYRKRMWYLVQSMDDLTADCWDAIVSQWLAEARSPDGKVWISIDQILGYRGLASHHNGGHRGGYTSEQRAAVTEALLRIISMRLQGFAVEVLEERDDGQGGIQLVPVRRQIGGPAVEVGLDLTQTDFLGRTEIKALLLRPGEMFARYYMGAGRSVALLSQKALTYQPYREVWEKRLTRYFAYTWDRHRDSVARQQHTVAELLEATHHQVTLTRPEATKERMEKALDRLAEDGVIAGWEYIPESWDEATRPRRHWAPVWLNARVQVTAPDEVKQFYQLALPDTTAGLALAPSLPSSIADGYLTGESVAALRAHYGLSQEAFARELGVSRTLVNLIENGKRTVSPKVREAIANWIARTGGQTAMQ